MPRRIDNNQFQSPMEINLNFYVGYNENSDTEKG